MSPARSFIFLVTEGAFFLVALLAPSWALTAFSIWFGFTASLALLVFLITLGGAE